VNEKWTRFKNNKIFQNNKIKRKHMQRECGLPTFSHLVHLTQHQPSQETVEVNDFGVLMMIMMI